MARINYNVITHGLSGKVGDLVVFIQRHGKTFLGKLPRRSGKVSPEQQAVREKFEQAAQYAQSCMVDPGIKALYAERAAGGVTPFNLAVADFFESPVIADIITSDYTGAVGSLVKVKATDDTKVTRVKISIMASDDSLIEEGIAIQEASSDQWVYSATAVNPTLTGNKIIAVATDLPGNTGSAQKLL